MGLTGCAYVHRYVHKDARTGQIVMSSSRTCGSVGSRGTSAHLQWSLMGIHRCPGITPRIGCARSSLWCCASSSCLSTASLHFCASVLEADLCRWLVLCTHCSFDFLRFQPMAAPAADLKGAEFPPGSHEETLGCLLV